MSEIYIENYRKIRGRGELEEVPFSAFCAARSVETPLWPPAKEILLRGS